MNILLITDTYPPLKGSGAIQFRDLSHEIVRQGHHLIVLVPRPDLIETSVFRRYDGVELYHLRSLPTKDVGLVRRTFNELLLPFFMTKGIRHCGLSFSGWDAVIWHSPSIFFGPLVSKIRKKSACKSYLIIRDIFPDWAVDLGLIRRNSLVHYFFNAIAHYQYSVADSIGVQSQGNLRYFRSWGKRSGRRPEVLQNWLGKPSKIRCSIRVDQTELAGRRIFVYAGNMGVAQGMDILLDLAEKFRNWSEVGFLFVGRGSDLTRLKTTAKSRQLTNVLFFDEIEPDEIPDLYSQCHVGIVALDPRHKSHNIPGKFLTYMQSGLPVLANINAGNDLAQMIRDEDVGEVCETNDGDELADLADRLLTRIEAGEGFSDRCRDLFEREFSVEKAVRQIVAAFSMKDAGNS